MLGLSRSLLQRTAPLRRLGSWLGLARSRHSVWIALLALASPARDPLRLSGRSYFEDFEGGKLSATQLVPAPGPGSLRIVGAQGRSRLLMTGDTGFLLPVPAAGRVRLAFDLARGGRGLFMLGDDRDPQHGFSKILHVRADGRLETCGRSTEIRLAAETRYRIEVTWSWQTDHRFVLHAVHVAGPGVSQTLPCNVALPGRDGAPLAFRQRGEGWAAIDEILIRGL